MKTDPEVASEAPQPSFVESLPRTQQEIIDRFTWAAERMSREQIAKALETLAAPEAPPPPKDDRFADGAKDAADFVDTLSYQAHNAARNRPCGAHPCMNEFPGRPSRWCSGCLIAALLAEPGASSSLQPRLRDLLAEIGLIPSATIQSVQRRLHVGTADAMRLLALREALAAPDKYRAEKELARGHTKGFQ